LAFFIDDGRHPESLAAHLAETFTERSGRTDRGELLTRSHRVFDAKQQSPAENAARMRASEVFLREAARFQDRNGDRIADGERGRRTGGGSKVMRTCLFRHADIENDIRCFAEGRAWAARHRDDGDA